jgi:hypothetical protein
MFLMVAGAQVYIIDNEYVPEWAHMEGFTYDAI